MMKILMSVLLIVLLCCGTSGAQSTLTVDNLVVSNSATVYGNLSLVGAQPVDAASNSLALYYKFTDSTAPAPDSSVNGNAASVSGAVWNANGLTNGGCYTFTGTNQWLETATNLPSLNQTTELTVMAWIKLSSVTSTQYPMIITKGPSSGAVASQSGNYEFRVNNNGALYFSSQYATNASQSAVGVRRVDDSSWHMVAATVVASSKVVRLYIDGALDSQQVMTNTPIAYANTEPVRIGRRKDGYFFFGSIDEPRIYGRALSVDEMARTYAYFIQLRNLATLTADKINQTGMFQTNVFMGPVGIGTSSVSNALTVAGTVAAANFTGNGNALTNIAGSNIVNASITGAKIASATVTGGNIANATITGTQIAGSTVTGGNIANNTITAANISTNSVLAGVNADKVDGLHGTDFALASQGAKIDLLNSVMNLSNGVATATESFDVNWSCAPCTNFMTNLTNAQSGWVVNNAMITNAPTQMSAPYVCMLKEISATNAWIRTPLLPSGYSKLVFSMQATSNNAPILMAVEASYDSTNWISQGSYSNAATNLNWYTFTNTSSGPLMYSSQYLRLHKLTESASTGYRVRIDSVTVTAPAPHAMVSELQVNNIVGPVNFAGASVSGLKTPALGDVGMGVYTNGAGQ